MKNVFIATNRHTVGGGIERVLQELKGVERNFRLFFNIQNPIEFNIHPLKSIFDGLRFREYFVDKNIMDKYDIINFHFPSDIFRCFYVKDFVDVSRSVITVHTTMKGRKKRAYKNTPLSEKTFEEIFSEHISSHLILNCEQKCFNSGMHITTVSNNNKSELENYYNVSEVSVIENGVSNDRLKTKEKLDFDKPVILYLGGLRTQKGIFFAINALEKIELDFKFLIAGTGLLENKIKDRLNRSYIDNDMLGFVKESKIPVIYNTADILIMPSIYEGHPMVALEGIATELPIVGFRGAVLDEIVSEENIPFICDDFDVECLREKVEKLLSDIKLRNFIGQKNKEKYKKDFTAKKMADRYYQFFKGIE